MRRGVDEETCVCVCVCGVRRRYGVRRFGGESV